MRELFLNALHEHPAKQAPRFITPRTNVKLPARCYVCVTCVLRKVLVRRNLSPLHELTPAAIFSSTPLKHRHLSLGLGGVNRYIKAFIFFLIAPPDTLLFDFGESICVTLCYLVCVWSWASLGVCEWVSVCLCECVCVCLCVCLCPCVGECSGWLGARKSLYSSHTHPSMVEHLDVPQTHNTLGCLCELHHNTC